MKTNASFPYDAISRRRLPRRVLQDGIISLPRRQPPAMADYRANAAGA